MVASRPRHAAGGVSQSKLQVALLESAAALPETIPQPQSQAMKRTTKTKLARGIRQRADGSYQVSKMIRGVRTWQPFPAGTAESTMVKWREDQKPAPALDAPPADSFAADIRQFGKLRAATVTIKGMIAILHQWAGALGRDRRRDSITRQEIQIVMQTWLAAGVAPVTVRKRASILQTFFKELNGADGENPVQRVQKPPAPKYGAPRALDYETIARILAHVQPRRSDGTPSGAYYRLRVLAYTGIPPGVLAKLTRASVRLSEAVVELPPRLKGEGVEARTIELTEQGVAEFRALDRAGLFGPFDRTTTYEAWTRAAAAAGVVDETGAVVTTQYDLRHSFGTMLYAETRDLATVARFLGHAEDSKVTKRYAKGANRIVDRAAAALVSRRLAAAIAAERRRSFDTNSTAV